MTSYTGEFVTIARPDAAWWLERVPSRRCMLQTSGETLPIVKEASVELTPGRNHIRIWVFVAEILDEFILGLNILHVYYAFVVLGHHMLQIREEEVSLWCPRAEPSRPVFWWPCNAGRMRMRGSGDGSTGKSPWSRKWGLYIARTLVRDQQEVPVSPERYLSRPDTHEGIPLTHYEPITVLTPLDAETPRAHKAAPQLQDVIAAAR
jgi:hypothetical protein